MKKYLSILISALFPVGVVNAQNRFPRPDLPKGYAAIATFVGDIIVVM